MKTKEIGLTALQNNGVTVIVNKNTCHVLLTNGKTVSIECTNERDASNVKNTILYYPTVKDNAGYEFDFEVEITIKPNWII